jgi:hypothetical protein
VSPSPLTRSLLPCGHGAIDDPSDEDDAGDSRRGFQLQRCSGRHRLRSDEPDAQPGSHQLVHEQHQFLSGRDLPSGLCEQDKYDGCASYRHPFPQYHHARQGAVECCCCAPALTAGADVAACCERCVPMTGEPSVAVCTACSGSSPNTTCAAGQCADGYCGYNAATQNCSAVIVCPYGQSAPCGAAGTAECACPAGSYDVAVDAQPPACLNGGEILMGS